MALTAARVTVSTSAVALNTAHPTKPVKLFVTNTSANAADLGGSGVTAGAGFSLPASSSASIELDPGDVLFAIRSAAADAVLSVLRV